ncbi:MAG: hypothetical protein JST55_06020 [Bacteroidetes bacterium]|nr:hypothetical protein [Bacteroidota bacterium]
MTKIKSLLALFVFASFCLMGFSSAMAVEAPSVSATTNKKSFSPGESGVLTLKFKTGDHVKIPKDPEIEVTITDGVDAGSLQDYAGGSDDYLSSPASVKYNFTVPSGAASGTTITIKGKVKFGYCNSADGVCKIGTKNFTAKIKVK